MPPCVTLAKKMARKSTRRNRHGAVILSSGNPISCGYNKEKTSPHTEMNDYYETHAEEDAIRQLVRAEGGVNTKGMDILVVRIDGNDKLMLSRPCPKCMEQIKNAGFRKLYYSDYNGIKMEVL